jgi:hypothetical protein
MFRISGLRQGALRNFDFLNKRRIPDFEKKKDNLVRLKATGFSFEEFKWGGLYKYAVATWNFENILVFAWRRKKTKKACVERWLIAGRFGSMLTCGQQTGLHGITTRYRCEHLRSNMAELLKDAVDI